MRCLEEGQSAAPPELPLDTVPVNIEETEASVRSPRQQPGRKKTQQRTDASPQPDGREGACSVPLRNAPYLQFNSATQPASAAASSEQMRNSPVGETMSCVNVSESHVNISELKVMVNSLHKCMTQRVGRVIASIPCNF